MRRAMMLCAAVLCLTMTLAPTALAAGRNEVEICYPTAITQSEDGTELRKLYDLGPEDDPTGIPRSDFEQDGFHYTLTDLLRQELPEHDERQHTETVSLQSANKDMASILALLPQEKEFITEDGYVLTNYHVISTAHQYGYAVSVLTYDGTTYQATIVGVDEDNDIALLKIDATGMTPVTFGDSDSMSVGDTVYAVGNPLGELEFTMTSGMISALDRTITTSDGTDSGINMFQIDAAVNAGNSGGPVYNTSGQVIGIVTAKYSSSGVEGLGFAIPVNDAVAIANDLMKNGTVTDRAQLGITLQTIPDSAAQYYNMPDGAYVNAVNSGSCAEKAGLKAGDIITAIDDTAVSSGDALRSALRGYSAGESATLTVSRSGETLKLTVTFDRASDSTK